jgi:hypothetical protein
LYYHGEELQSVVCDGVTLIRFKAEESGEDEESDEDGEPQAKKQKTAKLQYIKTRDYTWFSVFEQLLVFPNLQEVRFSDLRQEEVPWRPARCREHGAESIGLVGGPSMAAEGESIALKLGLAVQEHLTVTTSGYASRDKVWV